MPLGSPKSVKYVKPLKSQWFKISSNDDKRNLSKSENFRHCNDERVNWGFGNLECLAMGGRAMEAIGGQWWQWWQWVGTIIGNGWRQSLRCGIHCFSPLVTFSAPQPCFGSVRSRVWCNDRGGGGLGLIPMIWSLLSQMPGCWHQGGRLQWDQVVKVTPQCQQRLGVGFVQLVVKVILSKYNSEKGNIIKM